VVYSTQKSDLFFLNNNEAALRAKPSFITFFAGGTGLLRHASLQ
jgi:hypothetical protein